MKLDIKELVGKMLNNFAHGTTTAYSTQSITNDTAFTASSTGWAVCTLTTNSGQTTAPYASFDIYNGNTYIGLIDSNWGLVTSGATLSVSGPVQKGQNYRVHAVRCSIASFRIFT